MTVAVSNAQAPAPAQALKSTPAMPFASVGEPAGTDAACPFRIAPPAAGASSEKELGGVWSTVKVVEESAPTPLRLSIGRTWTVYEPSAGKLDARKTYDQLEPPLAATNTGVALENPLPFQ